MSAIETFSSNIATGNIINVQDFVNLKSGLINELKRRSLSTEKIELETIINDAYEDEHVFDKHADAVELSKKYCKELIDKTSYTAKDFLKGDVIKADDFKDTIDYAKKLMNTVVPRP